jgi:4-aminobutyrate aminotransferase-like enzyme
MPLNTKSSRILSLLRAYESRNVTFIEPDGSWPIVWERARGVHVWDAGGKKYLDLTAAFGVAAAGHANPHVVRAGQKQMVKLLHAMGDVHPHELKAKLARELSRITFERWSKLHHPQARRSHAKTIFCNSGFEAVEAALKTAMLATGKSGVVAFEGAYHGLGYGALNATHRQHFRSRFHAQLGGFCHFVPYPSNSAAGEVTRLTPKKFDQSLVTSVAIRRVEKALDSVFRKEWIGAVIVEPIQARGGINVPPPEFLRMLRRLCDEHGTLLILDEIYTGFGRTGAWFACEHSGVMPDVICLGKALTGGFPLSACVGRADVMDKAWPPSSGEAIHTSTFLGHPVGCAMGLANIEAIRAGKLVARSARLGGLLLCELSRIQNSNSDLVCRVRGVGLMVGLELLNSDGTPATETSLRVIKRLLHRGYIFLPEGEHANVISFTPPLVISENQIKSAVVALAEALSS